MKIKSIEIDNFLSFKNKQILEFAELGYINFLIGLNGSGKSNLFKAIEFGKKLSNMCLTKINEKNITPNKTFISSDWINNAKEIYNKNANDNFIFSSNKKIYFAITYKIQFLDIENVVSYFFNKIKSMFFSNIVLSENTIDEIIIQLEKMFEKIAGNKSFIKNEYQMYFENNMVQLKSATTFVDKPNYDINKLLLEYDESLKNPQLKTIIETINNYLFTKYLNINFFDLFDLVIWKPSDKYNLQNSVSLQKFIQNPSEVSIPLLNICRLVKKATNKEVDLLSLIKELFDGNKNQIDDSRIEETITKHINQKVNEYLCKVWYDFKNKDIKIHTKIKNNTMFFYILNAHNVNNELSIIMNESDGFKQMLSIILTLTSDFNNQGKLILIDEPEVHLHPSSIIALRKELFNMSFKNQIIVSTHSPFMVDRNNLDWYHELEWNNGQSVIYSDLIKTRSNQLPKIIESCFGIDTISNFQFSKINLLVEGKTDLDILDWITKQDNSLSIRIQQGDGHNIPKYLENIYRIVPANYFYNHTVILVDNDEGGRKITEEVKKLSICKKHCPLIINYADILEDSNITILETIYELDSVKDIVNKLEQESDTEGNFKLELASLVEEKDLIKQEYKDKFINYFKNLQNKISD